MHFFNSQSLYQFCCVYAQIVEGQWFRYHKHRCEKSGWSEKCFRKSLCVIFLLGETIGRVLYSEPDLRCTIVVYMKYVKKASVNE